jgi:FkbM family methyltransferase
MDLREYVKRVLRIVGHALVVTVHDRLNEIERQVGDAKIQMDDANIKLNRLTPRFDDFGLQLSELRIQNANLAESEGALLQSAIHMGEALQRTQDTLRRQSEALDQHDRQFEESQQYLEQLLREQARDNDRRQSEASEHYCRQLQELLQDLRQFCDQAQNREQRQGEVLDQVLEKIDAHRRSMDQAMERLEQMSQQGHALCEPTWSRIEALHRDMMAALEALTGEVGQQRAASAGFEKYTRSVLENEVVRQVCVETDDYGSINPEAGLLTFLYSYLPTPKAIDAGAHAGDVAERLLQAGFEVYAFEPSAPTFERLNQRLGGRPGFHPFNIALGSSDGEMPLHLATDRSVNKTYRDASAFSSLTRHSMPEDLPFTDSIRVPVRTLASLHRSGSVPQDISLAKIDTEGFDLEVIRGMGEHRYPIVIAEYWDPETWFGRSGLLYTLETLVGEMRSRGYQWHIVAYRIWGRDQTAYYCNHSRSVPNSGGNVLFFRDYEVFRQAQAWCSAVLSRTYFKPVPSPDGKRCG